MNFLILSVTAGEGHNSTARAIQTELQRLGADCTILDTFDYISPELAKLISEGYLLVTEKAKTAYKLGYRIAEKRRPNSEHTPMKIMNLAMSDDLAEFINADSFDVIIFTHPFAGMILDVMKERRIIQNRTLGILTDFTFHPYWEDCTRNDYVVTPDKLLLHQARRKGFRDDQILPFGIPISPKFQESMDKAAARRALGIDENLHTLLLMGGSMGYGNMGETVAKIDQIDSSIDFQMLIVCGNNEEAKEKIEKISLTARHRMQVYGFVRNVPTLMDASDCLISKPGGLTTSESLAKGLPMIIVNPIPGQEERNAEFLLNSGCALQTSKTYPIDECIYQLLTSETRLKAMQLSISSIGKPNSTEELGRFLIDLAHTPIIESDPLSTSDFADNPLFVDEDGYLIR